MTTVEVLITRKRLDELKATHAADQNSIKSLSKALVQARQDREKAFVSLYNMLGLAKGYCKDCGALIYWVTTLKGRAIGYARDGRPHFIDCTGKTKKDVVSTGKDVSRT